ncbi:phosphatase PAP2 family protein [Acinetobacter sp. ASP199]|nr:phosphatase PAP2 family protein [Acinetobacter sp. ASP199]
MPLFTFALLSPSLYAADDSYLTPHQAPNSLLILPEPPAPSSAGFIRDQSIFKQMQLERSEAKWKQAAIDADVSNEHLGVPFSEAFGLEISEKNTPILFNLLKKVKRDSRYSTQDAKKHYNRKRPFAHFGVKTCTPHEETSLNQNGSYPSGHTTIGWTYALILAEIRPDRQNEIFKRGFDFGQSRVICNMHWQSDVDAGRITGAAQFARLQADPTFQADIAKAKIEVQHLLNKILK